MKLGVVVMATFFLFTTPNETQSPYFIVRGHWYTHPLWKGICLNLKKFEFTKQDIYSVRMANVRDICLETEQ